ncbi:MAG: hypothetical protein JXR84_12290, partial [Anaerolineae bacterium]|nr:hypothetical protein [Anaerolineae bacterium]
MARTEKRITLLGQVITPQIVRQVVRAASLVQWGTHLLRLLSHQSAPLAVGILEPEDGHRRG